MRNIILTAGHYGYKSGAWRRWFDEGLGTIDLRDRLTKSLRKKGLTVVNDSDHERTGHVIKWVNQGNPEDILIELHFNAVDSPLPSGTECFVQFHATELEKELAAELCESASSILGIPNRGVKTPSLSQFSTLAILDKTHAQAVLFEVCFMSNPGEIKTYQARVSQLVRSLSTKIFNAAQQ